ncbi:hypothetical protein WJX73_010026 [Symbiochloris irregularis]|uniref:Uncharacterized protein n=1 Tax=Symbiochloris irregularis TaxID=706552 RepID=A0AAW1PVU4_9CHLO
MLQACNDRLSGLRGQELATQAIKVCSHLPSVNTRSAARQRGTRSGATPGPSGCSPSSWLRKDWTCRAAPTWNPQNVPDPEVMPSPGISAEEAVKVQLDALKNCHTPWTNHGIQTMYEYGLDIGGMERSRYFGMSKDLYHFDHFLGQFQNSFPDLFDMASYSIKGVEEAGEETHVTVEGQTTQGKTFALLFKMAERDFGKKKGSIMTKSLLKK